MNTMEKFGAAIAGIAIVASIVYYATSGTSAFNPQPGLNRALPNIAVYISDNGDDLNSGRTVIEPVRTIRRAVDVTNSVDNANVSILFTEDLYNIVYTDMVESGNHNPQDIIITNPNSISLKPVGSIASTVIFVGDLPGSYSALLPILLANNGPKSFTLEGLNFMADGYWWSSLPVRIHSEGRTSLTIKDNEFGFITPVPPPHGPRPTLPTWGLDISAQTAAFIKNNRFHIPVRADTTWGITGGLKINPITSRASEITVMNNLFIFPENYDQNYEAPWYNFNKYIGINALAGNLKVIDNEFKTQNYLNQPNMYLYNLHNVGVFTGHGAVTSDIVNNNFMHFDGANVVSQSHIENSYPDSNKQNVIIRDNYMGRI